MNDRKCPDCGERLSFDALRCACGWGGSRGEKGAKFTDMRCTFKSGTDRCSYPVGMFPEGASHGWCIFHRQTNHGSDAVEIVRQSQSVPYRKAIQLILDHTAKAASVVDLAHTIALRHGNKPWQAGNESFLSDAVRRDRAKAA